MIYVLLIIIVVSIFEVRGLFRSNKKKEAILYIAVAAAALMLGAFVLLVPEYKGFSKNMLDLFGIKNR